MKIVPRPDDFARFRYVTPQQPLRGELVEPLSGPAALPELSATTALSVPPQLRPWPVIADANVLIRDVLANLRRPKDTALLGLAEAGYARLLGTETVASEVDEHLARVAGKARATAAFQLWRSRYLPVIRWVAEPGTLLLGSPAAEARVAGVAARDIDDVPTAQLGLLCAPALLVTADRDLLDHGFGATEFVAALVATGQLSQLDGSLLIGLRLTGISVESAGRAVVAAGRFLARSEWMWGAALGTVAYVVAHQRSVLRERGREVQAAGRKVGKGVAEVLTVFFEQRQAHINALADCLVEPLADPTIGSTLCRELARTPAPVPAAALHRRVGATLGSLDVDERAVRATLRGSEAFVLVQGQGWQLGETRSVASTPAIAPSVEG
jgi:hypothetical protein